MRSLVVPGELQLALLHHVGGVGKRGPHVAAGIVLQLGVERGVAAGVVEMQMGIDHPADVAGQEAGGGERVLQLGRALQSLVLDAVDVEELGVLLVAEGGVDEHQAVGMLDQQAAHRQRDPAPLVVADPPAPERIGHHAEHRAAVEALDARPPGCGS